MLDPNCLVAVGGTRLDAFIMYYLLDTFPQYSEKRPPIPCTKDQEGNVRYKNKSSKENALSGTPGTRGK